MVGKGKGAASGNKSDDSKIFAFLSVLLSIVGFLLAYFVKRDDKYVMFYAKQSLIIFFGWIILWVVGMVLWIVPIVGSMIHWVLYLGLIILWVIGLVYSLSGEMKEIPIVGKYANKINL
ncbi:MAG: DUF4870 domain-containing protein [Nanoarchaeota archaeon]|mgnify:CR=1 FL=1